MIARYASLLLLILSVDLAAQDLLDRSKEEEDPIIRKRFSKDRAELTVSAPLVSDKAKDGGLRVGLEARGNSSFLCGKFDSFAGIRDLVTDDLGSRGSQMLLDIAEGELVSNGMTLLATASPTLFDLMKHYRFSAQALLQLSYDKCRAVDRALESGKSSLQGEALKGCLAQKQKAGVSLPRALKECETEVSKQRFRNLNGQYVESIDLNEEFDTLFGRGESWPVLSKLKLTPGGVKGEIKVNPLEPEYLKRRDHFAKLWDGALSKHLAGEKLTDQELERLTPPWASYRIGRQDLAALAAMDPRHRNVLLGQLATDFALLDLGRRIQLLDRKLAVAAAKAQQSAGTPVEVARQWQAQRKHLRESLGDLLATRRLVSLANASYSKFLQNLERNKAIRARANIATLGQIQQSVIDKGIGNGMYPVHQTSTKPSKTNQLPDLLKRIARSKTPQQARPNQKQDKPCCELNTYSWGE